MAIEQFQKKHDENGGSEQNGLNHEAASELAKPGHKPPGSKSEVHHAEPFQLEENGTYKARAGDSLWRIARQSLKLAGTPSKDPVDIALEVERIVELNRDKYPFLADHPEKLKAGTPLQIADMSALAPTPPKAAEVAAVDPNACPDVPIKEAKPGFITHVQKCERVAAGEDASVIVHPGGYAQTYDGAKAFVFRNGTVDAYGGYVIVGDGAQVQHYPRATLNMIGPANVTEHDQLPAEIEERGRQIVAQRLQQTGTAPDVTNAAYVTDSQGNRVVDSSGNPVKQATPYDIF